nr:ATP-binding protein [Halorussus amylolyticus]
MPDFVNRTEELFRLHSLYESDNSELAVIFGRRRLGKTELVKHSLRDSDEAVVYQAKQKTAELQLQQFIDVAAETYPGLDTFGKTGTRFSAISPTKMRSSFSTNSRISSSRTKACHPSSKQCSTTNSTTQPQPSSSSGRQSV